MQVSVHARKRLKERCGFNKKSCDRMAKKAYEEGIPLNKTKGRLRKWGQEVYDKNKSANNIRFYGDFAYIFCNDILVTILIIPNSLKKDLKKMIIS